MSESTPGLVDLVREFLAADVAMRRMVTRFRSGELEFAEVDEVVDDDERCALFRLKERCHTLFRPESGRVAAPSPRELLFDLAVGSLFHEAMKFRENFYQREVYGPRVRALRGGAGDEAEALFREFEHIEGTVSERLEEGLNETEALLAHTREQLFVLLSEHCRDGLVARFLIEHRDVVEAVFEEDLDTLLAKLYGDRAAGFAVAGRSYLASGFYPEAERAFTGAVARGGDRSELECDRCYARGMAAYLRGDYAESVVELARWAEPEMKRDRQLVDLAWNAVATLDRLVQGSDRARTLEAASALAARLRSLSPAPAAVQATAPRRARK